MDLSIAEAARTIAEVVGFRGQLGFDATKPDGAPFKALDSSVLLGMGWKPAISFREGIERNLPTIRAVAKAACGFATAHRPLPFALPHSPSRRRMARVYATDKIKSPVHLSIGQEAVSVGICDALQPRRRRLRHVSRPRPLPRQGRRPEQHGGRIVRQGDRLHEGQRRLDAPHRSRGRRDGHVCRRRHDHRQRRRLRLRDPHQETE